MHAEPHIDEEGLKMSRFWFSSINNDLKNKRSKEEMLVTLNQWSTAKQRLIEDISTKIERVNLVSNPSKLAVMSQPDKALLHKIYHNEQEFLDSDESSLNTTVKSEVEVKEVQEVISKANTVLSEGRRYSDEYDRSMEEED